MNLARLLSQIACDLDAEQTLESTMQALVAAAVDAIPGADAAVS